MRKRRNSGRGKRNSSHCLLKVAGVSIQMLVEVIGLKDCAFSGRGSLCQKLSPSCSEHPQILSAMVGYT